MKIVVFGASGKVGRIVVELLLKNKYEVKAFVHSNNPFEDNPNLEVVKGDIYNRDDVVKAIMGVDVVICVIGSWGTKRKDVVSSGINNIIVAMEANGVSRVISLTGADALKKGDKQTLLSRLTHLVILASPARKILKDGELHIELLLKNDLKWTTIRSPIMNNRGRVNSYHLTDKRPRPWEKINRASVAMAIVNLVEVNKYIKQAPYISKN